MEKEIKTWTFQGRQAGPRLLALGAIHGNEKCGTEAISRLIVELEAGIVTLDAGTLICAPICNPAAYAAHTRFVDENLNRIIRRHAPATGIEQPYANQVTTLIDNCDILLDLHSYSAGIKPFLFLDREDDAHRAYATALDIPYWVTGWNDAYAKAGELNDGDTVSYAHSQDKLAILVECGIHTDPAGGNVGYNSLRAALAHFKMAAASSTVYAQKPLISRLSQIIAKQRNGEFTQPWQHLDNVKKGDVIARYADGEEVLAPHDGVVILPDAKAKTGNEWIYFGRNES